MIRILQGDCTDVMRTLERGSIGACVTDPPYELGFMGKRWDSTGIAFSPETWRLVFDAMKPGAYLVAFASARGYHRMVCAIEDAGFVIHPMLGWISGQGFPKAMNLSKQIDKHYGAEREIAGHRKVAVDKWTGEGRRRTDAGETEPYDVPIHTPATPEARQWEGWAYGLQSLKPALEPICLAQKPAIRAGMVANVLQHGTGAINIDACRVAGAFKSGWSDSGGSKASENLSMRGANYARDPKPDSALGRWPANVLHDGSEEVEAAFAAFGERGGAAPPSQTGSPTTVSDYGTYAHRSDVFHRDSGTASRFFYSSKADKGDRADSRHPTVKPVDLMRWLVRLVTPPGGTILDPFAGSGSTGEAAMLEGFDCIMIERDPQSVADIRHRIKRWSGEDAPLFAGVAE